MQHKRLALAFCLILVGARYSHADVDNVRTLLQSILDQHNESLLPKIPDIAAQIADDIRTAGAEQVESLLPLAQRCLRSSSPTVRGHGLSLFFSVAFRSDSSALLKPYIDGDIAPLLDDPDRAFGRGAIYILGNTKPAPLPNALRYLAAHLNDKKNSNLEAGMIAAALVAARPSDAGTVHSVLNLVRQRPDLNMKGNVIQMLGSYQIATQESLEFVREGLHDGDSSIRRISIDAIGRMPNEVRSSFTSELHRLIAMPDEAPEVRSRAEQVLRQ
jgi:hypothetical protein